ncbi:MAG: mandelate racemase/muconate lactonizing enzyme family protein [Bacteroidota bacterium]
MSKHTSLDRRDFLRHLGLGALGLGLSPGALASVEELEPIKITKVETVRFAPSLQVGGRGIQWMWVRLHTSNGLIGTGETYPFNEATESVIKDFEWHSWAGKLLGANPLEIEHLWQRLFGQAAYHVFGGAEMRAMSAINLALWDILGQHANLPVYQLLGGSADKHIRVYNTYTNARNINGWKLEEDMPQIAQFLVDQGISAIKYCPFDWVGRKNNGEYISKNDIDKSLEWIKKVRDTVGFDLEIGCEFHSLWNLPSAMRIAQALEPYDILFLEDILLQDNMQAYVPLARETSIPIVISERLATRFDFREMFESKAGDIAMYDLTWCGGISEGKKISDMANTYYLPTMMHTAGGPILWYASTHLAAAITNLFYVESVYPNWAERYPFFFDNVPQVDQGIVKPPNLPGLGLQFKPGLFERDDVIVNVLSGS